MTSRKDAASTAANPSIPDALRAWVLGVVGSDRCEPMGPGRYLLRVPIDDLATSLGYARRSGSLSRRLRRLEDLGIVVSRRPVVFDVTPLSAPTPVPSLTPATATALVREGLAGSSDSSLCRGPVTSDVRNAGSWFGQLADLAHRAFTQGDRDVCLAALETAQSLLGMPAPAPVQWPVPAPGGAPHLETDREPPLSESLSAESLPSARNPRAAVSKKKTSSSSTSTPGSSAGMLPSPAGRRRSRPLPVPASPADRGRVDALIAPLVTMCHQRGLPGVSSSAGVHAALAPLTDPEIRFGVSAVCELLAAGNQLRSPIGLLVSLARRGELRAHAASVPPPHPVPAEEPACALGPLTACAQPAQPRTTNAPEPSLPRGADDWLRAVHDLMREESAQLNQTPPRGDLPGTV